jgi:hypothetical protein
MSQGGYFLPNEVVEIAKCRYCYAPIGFFVSVSKGTKYAVNAHEIDGEWKAHRRDFHNCERGR